MRIDLITIEMNNYEILSVYYTEWKRNVKNKNKSTSVI